MACCVRFAYDIGAGIVQIQLLGSGTYNTLEYYEFVAGGVTYFIWWSPSSVGNGQWVINRVLGSFTGIVGGTKEISEVTCPPNGQDGDGVWNAPTLPFTAYFFSDCVFDCNTEDRTKKQFSSIKLPSDFVEDDRGVKGCCCKFNVLADPSSDTWKNDKTSAWIKTSDALDTFTFKLYKDGALTTYTPTPVQFPQDNNAYYSTINWIDVLNSDGVGCYEFLIEYSISGISGSLSWGEYNLQPYSIQNAINTARVRAIFNGVQEVQDINFTDSNVESSFRFFGYIGNRQPNTETDNIIYNNREMKRVIRENLNTYEIITDPSDDCIIRPLVDLYLLSENQLFISDYNATNPSYRYQDTPVIVSDSPSLEYFDQSRKVRLTCVVSDKFKNKRTYY